MDNLKIIMDDSISRQQVLEALEKERDWLIRNNMLGAEHILVHHAINMIDNIPPERKKGKWIGHREHCENLGVMPSGLGAYEWCSNCDCGIDVREWHRNNYNYCPNCGAKMEGEQNERFDKSSRCG